MTTDASLLIEKHNNIYVLRDDVLLGGTKSVFIEELLDKSKNKYVYASPVYGGFQIALSGVCKKLNKQAVIFCAKRKVPHENSLKCKELGAKVLQVPYGYLSNIQSKAKKYCQENNDAQLLRFGANYDFAIEAISKRMKSAISKIGREPDTIFCVIGSGTLVSGILRGTNKAKVIGISVGKECKIRHERLKVINYPKAFDKPSKIKKSFPSCSNYDLKGWEYCLRMAKPSECTFFWNVM